MKKYTGTKTVMAEPMTRENAEKIIGRKIVPNAEHSGEGYLVEYPDGYKSWSPKEVFEEAYSVSETPLDRMRIEQRELLVRLCRLKSFISENMLFLGLSKTEQSLLIAQCQSMENYHSVLSERINIMQNIS